MEGGAGTLAGTARPTETHAAEGVARTAYAKAAENANAVLGLAVAVALAALLMCGQMCHKSYLDGQAHGIAYGKAQAEQQAYDKGYAAAVYEYQEGDPEWARR